MLIENNSEEKTAFITQTNKLYNIMQENAPAMTQAVIAAYYKIEQGNCCTVIRVLIALNIMCSNKIKFNIQAA